MTEQRLHPPYVNVLFDPGSQNFPRSRVKKSRYHVKRLDCPVLIAAPK